MINSFTVNENYGLNCRKLNNLSMSPHKKRNPITTLMKLSSLTRKTSLRVPKYAQVLTEIRPL